MRLSRFLLVPLLLLPARMSAAAEGGGLSGESRTYFNAWESLDSLRHYSFYEYLDVDIETPGVAGLSFHFGGWGRADLGEESYGDATNGEFSYGYLNFTHEKADATLRLGRLAVSEGVALNESLDGLYARTGLAHGLTLALYGGIPLETDGDGRGDDLVYGGRFGVGAPGKVAAGVSYLKEENDGVAFREEYGVDLFVRLARYFRVDGQSAYNGIQSEWMDHDYRVVLGPGSGLTLSGEAWWVDYDSYFQSADFNAFRSPALQVGESALVLSGELEWAGGGGFSVAANYHNYSYDTMEDARSFGGRLAWAWADGGLGLTVQRVDGSLDSLRYTQYRGYVFQRFGPFDTTVDLLDVLYDEDVSGVGYAYALAGSLGYNLSSRVRLAADVEYSSTPSYEEQVRAFLKFQWRFPGTSAGPREDK